MKFADFFRGAAEVVLAGVNTVFDDARAAVSAAPLPANIKADLTTLLNDGQAALTSLEGLAGTLAGEGLAVGIDDITTLLLNTANAVSNSTSPAAFSVAEKTILQAQWKAMKAQGDTLIAQFLAGVDPAKPAG